MNQLARLVLGGVLAVAIQGSDSTVQLLPGVHFEVPAGWEPWPDALRSTYQRYRQEQGGRTTVVSILASDTANEWTALPYITVTYDSIPTTWTELERSIGNTELPPAVRSRFESLGVSVERMQARIETEPRTLWIYGHAGDANGRLMVAVGAMRLLRQGRLSVVHYGPPTLVDDAERHVRSVWAQITMDTSMQYHDATARRELRDRNPLVRVREGLVVVLLTGGGIGLLAVVSYLRFKCRSVRR